VKEIDVGPFIFLAGMALGVLVTVLAGVLADRLGPSENPERLVESMPLEDQPGSQTGEA
jgi:hypothetical protein